MFAIGMVLFIFGAFLAPKSPTPQQKPQALAGAVIGFTGSVLMGLSVLIFLWRALP